MKNRLILTPTPANKKLHRPLNPVFFIRNLCILSTTEHNIPYIIWGACIHSWCNAGMLKATMLSRWLFFLGNHMHPTQLSAKEHTTQLLGLGWTAVSRLSIAKYRQRNVSCSRALLEITTWLSCSHHSRCYGNDASKATVGWAAMTSGGYREFRMHWVEEKLSWELVREVRKKW